MVCGVTAHCSPTQARRDAHNELGFEISVPFICRPQDSASSFLLHSGFVILSLVDLQLLSFPHSPHAVRWLREERREVFMELRNKSGFNSTHLFRVNIFLVHILTLLREVTQFTCTADIYRELWLWMFTSSQSRLGQAVRICMKPV